MGEKGNPGKKGDSGNPYNPGPMGQSGDEGLKVAKKSHIYFQLINYESNF